MQKNDFIQKIIESTQVDDRKKYDKKSRIKDIELCIKFDNYFANLASILKFSIESSGLEDQNIGIIVDKIIKDLRYLQENYTIIEREDKDLCIMNNF